MKINTSFLPKGYELPAIDSNYFKFEKGKNKFRILSNALTGYEYWNKDKEVFRQEKPFKETPNIKSGDKQRHFWGISHLELQTRKNSNNGTHPDIITTNHY